METVNEDLPQDAFGTFPHGKRDGFSTMNIPTLKPCPLGGISYNFPTQNGNCAKREQCQEGINRPCDIALFQLESTSTCSHFQYVRSRFEVDIGAAADESIKFLVGCEENIPDQKSPRPHESFDQFWSVPTSLRWSSDSKTLAKNESTMLPFEGFRFFNPKIDLPMHDALNISL